MKKLQDNTFALTFGLLAAHELDAVRCFEWRVLPITSFLPDNIGMCWSQNLTVRAKSRTLFAGFCCVHVGLHWLFRNDPNYAFEGWLSNGLIGGAGLAGALFLLLIWQRRQKQ
jgi:hypothetical protein